MPDTSWYCMPVCVLWSLGFSDFPGTTCGSWNCNPGCAGHTTNVCPPQWDFWALNVSGKAAWWPTNLAKYSEDNLWKKNVYISWKLILKKLLGYPSLSFNCSHPCHFVVLVSSFSQQKNTQNVAVDHRHRLYGTAMDSMSKILPGQGPLWSSDLECLRCLCYEGLRSLSLGIIFRRKKEEKPQMSQIHILKYTNSTSDPALHPLSLAPQAKVCMTLWLGHIEYDGG